MNKIKKINNDKKSKNFNQFEIDHQNILNYTNIVTGFSIYLFSVSKKRAPVTPSTVR